MWYTHMHTIVNNDTYIHIVQFTLEYLYGNVFNSYCYCVIAGDDPWCYC